MSEQTSHAINGGCFHLKIGDAVCPEMKTAQLVVESGMTQRQSEHTALRSVKSRAGYRDAMMKSIHKMFEQGNASRTKVRSGSVCIQSGMSDERLQHLFFFFVVGELIKVEEVIESESVGTCHKCIYGNIGLQGSAGTDADDLQGFQLCTNGARFEVDVGQGIEFIEYDVDVIWTNAGTANGKAFVAHIAGMGDEFAVLILEFDAVEILADFFNAVGIADNDDGISNFFWTTIQVVYGAAFVEDKF